MAVYDVLIKDESEFYSRVLAEGLRHCPKALLVISKPRHKGESLYKFLSELNKYNSELRLGKEWPGTKLLVGEAELYYFDFTIESEEFLSAMAHSFFSWQLPDLPEDLILLRNDLSPWFVSISHEHDCFFDLAVKEIAPVRDALAETCEMILRNPDSSVGASAAP